MTGNLVADDPRYEALFDVAREAEAMGNAIDIDVNPGINRLRDRSAVLKGSLRQLLDLPESSHAAFDVEREHYSVLSFNACERAFRENLLFSSQGYRESPGVRNLGNVILAMTGNEHARYRAVVQPMFIRPKAIKWWRLNWIEEIAGALLDRLEGREGANLNFELCARLPMHTVTRGIGMDGDDALTFRDHLLRGTSSATASEEERRHSHAEAARMLRELITKRRAEPRDDVISGLITNDFELAEGGSRKLTDDEILGYCRLIMLAGGGTTWRQLGITIHALLSNYHFWEACRGDRSLIEAAIEESARWNPTDPTFPRLVMEDVEVEGTLIPGGARVDVCLGAANRDPRRWDHPDDYDIFREKKFHLGFSIGPHQCLGMNVAKQEMITALNGLMDRFPNMRLDPDAPPAVLMGGLEQRGMSAVQVRFH